MDAVTLILINVMSNSKYTVPPKMSGQGFTVVSSVRIIPVVVMFFMAVGATLVILMGCPRTPWSSTGLLAVATVVIGMADVVSMFGAIVGYFKPFMPVAVPLNDPLIRCG